ncbi:MAG TPA: hypothetical protein VGU43_07450 [Thermoplasmata archaeon]|nr:hypothetical protein [Thermoplasmata archaeon]
MRIRLEDVENCLENAVDLTEDAARCRSPVCVALAELGLEQACLTALVWGRYLLDEAGISERLGRGEACLPASPSSLALVAICADVSRFTDQEIMEASHGHEASLSHVDTVLGFMRELVPYVFGDEMAVRYPPGTVSLATRIGIAVRGRKHYNRRGRAEFESFMETARELDIPQLPKVKETYLYARVDRHSGRVSVADFDEDLFDRITELAVNIEEVVTRALGAAETMAKNAAAAARLVSVFQRIERALGERSGHAGR